MRAMTNVRADNLAVRCTPEGQGRFSADPTKDTHFLGQEYQYLVDVARYKFNPVTMRATPPK